MRFLFMMVLLMTMNIIKVVNSLTCKEGQIMRQNSSGNNICCYTNVCQPGEMFRFCNEDQGSDTCNSCPDGTYHMDKIYTAQMPYFMDPCVPMPTCDSSEIILMNGRCICNRALGFYGEDPNNCLLAEVTCTSPGFELKNNGNCGVCEAEFYKPESSPEYVCRPKSKCLPSHTIVNNGTATSDRVCEDEKVIHNTNTRLFEDEEDDDLMKSGDKSSLSKLWIHVVLALVLTVLLCIVILILIAKRRKKCLNARLKSNRDDTIESQSVLQEECNLVEQSTPKKREENVLNDVKSNRSTSKTKTPTLAIEDIACLKALEDNSNESLELLSNSCRGNTIPFDFSNISINEHKRVSQISRKHQNQNQLSTCNTPVKSYDIRKTSAKVGSTDELRHKPDISSEIKHDLTPSSDTLPLSQDISTKFSQVSEVNKSCSNPSRYTPGSMSDNKASSRGHSPNNCGCSHRRNSTTQTTKTSVSPGGSNIVADVDKVPCNIAADKNIRKSVAGKLVIIEDQSILDPINLRRINYLKDVQKKGVEECEINKLQDSRNKLSEEKCLTEKVFKSVPANERNSQSDLSLEYMSADEEIRW